MNDANVIESEGSTVDEAIERALETLGASRADCAIEILAHPSRGLFGLGGRSAKVRVRRAGPARLAPQPSPHGRPPLLSEASPEVRLNGRQLLEDLLHRMGFPSQVELEGEGEGAVLQIRGDDTNVLIGKHGQTLDAIEYVLNRIVSREEEAPVRIHIDCEQYRVKRQRTLQDLARRMGDEAKRKRRAITLNPMSPRDRRIVHLELQADPQVTTRSAGEGYFRKLVIIPEGEAARGRSRSR